MSHRLGNVQRIVVSHWHLFNVRSRLAGVKCINDAKYIGSVRHMLRREFGYP